MLDQEKREAERKNGTEPEYRRTVGGSREDSCRGKRQRSGNAERGNRRKRMTRKRLLPLRNRRKPERRERKSETGRDSQRSAGNGHAAEETEKEDQKWMIVAAIIVILLVVNIATKLLLPASLPALAGSYAQTGDVEQTLDTSGYVSSEVEETVFSPVTAYVSSSVLEEGSR